MSCGAFGKKILPQSTQSTQRKEGGDKKDKECGRFRIESLLISSTLSFFHSSSSSSVFFLCVLCVLCGKIFSSTFPQSHPQYTFAQERRVQKNPPGRGGHAWGREAKIGPVAGIVPPRSPQVGLTSWDLFHPSIKLIRKLTNPAAACRHLLFVLTPECSFLVCSLATSALHAILRTGSPAGSIHDPITGSFHSVFLLTVPCGCFHLAL